MKLPNSAHTDRPWRIHEIAPDFALVDVWELPTPGDAGDFPRLVETFVDANDDHQSTRASRLLFAIRWKVGRILGWDGTDQGTGTRVTSVIHRLPDDLRAGARGPAFTDVGFVSLYQTSNEWVAELANRTVHALLHMGWVADDAGVYRGQMAVLVKPQGRLGRAYMAIIDPFRLWFVYPPMMRAIGRRWAAEQDAS